MRAGVRDGRVLALLGIALLALGMRSPSNAFSPDFAGIDADLHLGEIVLGLVGAAPLVGFAVSSFVAPRLARRVGLESAIVLAITAIVLGQLARATALEPTAVVLGTMLTMLGIGIGNVLLPPVVKRYFPDRIGLVSAVYLTLFGVGAASPGFAAVPLGEVLGWRVTLAIWASTVALAIIPWIALSRRPRLATGPIDIVGFGESDVRVARSPIAWGLVLVMIGSASAGYSAAAWLPSILRDVAGLDAVGAGVQAGILFAVGIPVALLVPIGATRPGVAALLIAAAVLAGVVGWGGLLVAPDAPATIWAVLIGLASLTFPLILVQIAARASTPRVAARLSGFVQGVAYVATGVVVFGVGVVHTLTGGWTVPLVLLVVMALVPAPAIWMLRRPDRVG